MALSGLAHGEFSPNAYNPDDPNNPNYDPVKAEEYKRERARQIGQHVGNLSGEGFGENQAGFIIPGDRAYYGESNDERN